MKDITAIFSPKCDCINVKWILGEFNNFNWHSEVIIYIDIRD